MKINSVKFARGIVGDHEILEDGIPHVVFLGRSNVGKSSVINSLTGQKDMARSSSQPGRTKEVNLFLVNNAFYLADLPGYGFAKGSFDTRDSLQRLIQWYLLHPNIPHKKVVLIVDAKVGPTDLDIQMLHLLELEQKDIVVVANKIDKLKKNELKKQIEKIEDIVGVHTVIPYSAEKKIGIQQLLAEISA